MKDGDRVGPPIQGSTCIPHRFPTLCPFFVLNFWERERGKTKNMLYLVSLPNPTTYQTKLVQSYEWRTLSRKRDSYYIERWCLFQTRIWNLNLRIEIHIEHVAINTATLGRARHSHTFIQLMLLRSRWPKICQDHTYDQSYPTPPMLKTVAASEIQIEKWQ